MPEQLSPAELREQLDRVWPNQDDRVMMGGGEWATVAKEVFGLLDAVLAGWEAAEAENKKMAEAVVGFSDAAYDEALARVSVLEKALLIEHVGHLRMSLALLEGTSGSRSDESFLSVHRKHAPDCEVCAALGEQRADQEQEQPHD